MPRVKGEGLTVTTLEYYAEAEPRLLKLRDLYREKKATKDQVFDSCRKIAGISRISRDMDAIKQPDWGPLTWVQEFTKWQDENPLVVRMYGSPGVIATLVMAADDANEIEIPFEHRI
jgi:hypothetical protein